MQSKVGEDTRGNTGRNFLFSKHSSALLASVWSGGGLLHLFFISPVDLKGKL